MTMILGILLIIMLIAISLGAFQGNRTVIVFGMVGLTLVVIAALFLIVVGIPKF